MLRYDAATNPLVGTLPLVPATDSTGADAMLKAIRGYTVEEIVDAAATAGLSGEQANALIRAMAARFSAKRARKAGAA